jgi:protein subunit release factor A
MMMSELYDYLEKISKAVAILNKMLQNNELTKDEYGKQMIGLAHDLAVFDKIEEAFNLIIKVDKDYFFNQMIIDAETDKMFETDIIELAAKINQYNKKNDLTPNMPVGKA